MKKKFLLLTVIVSAFCMSGCLWFLYHGQILAKSNQRLDFTVFYFLPNKMVAISCLGANNLSKPESEDIVLYDQKGWAVWVVDRVDVNGNELTDSKGRYLGQAITTTETTPAFTDSGGTPIYAAKFRSIRIGQDASALGEECWSTSGYAMDNRAPYKAKIVASYPDAQGNPVNLNVYTEAEATCIATQVSGGATVGAAMAACGNVNRKVLHLYANQLHAPL